jgi:hypothetical protein
MARVVGAPGHLGAHFKPQDIAPDLLHRRT